MTKLLSVPRPDEADAVARVARDGILGRTPRSRRSWTARAGIDGHAVAGVGQGVGAVDVVADVDAEDIVVVAAGTIRTPSPPLFKMTSGAEGVPVTSCPRPSASMATPRGNWCCCFVQRIAVGTVAFALCFATPPPKMSDDPSAFKRVIDPCTPVEAVTLPFIRASSVNAAQITDHVCGARVPPAVAATVGMGVVPSGWSRCSRRGSLPLRRASGPRDLSWRLSLGSANPWPAYCASKSTLVSMPMPL